MPKKPIGMALMLAVFSDVALALATLIPAPGPHKNDLGYFSLCPFAPWSTLALLLFAGVIWTVRGYVLSRTD